MSDVHSQIPWWEATQTSALSPALAMYTYLTKEDTRRATAYNAYSSIYLNRDITNASYLQPYRAAWKVENDSQFSRVPVNLAKVVIDSVHAKITKQNPRPVFVTRHGNYELHKKAQQMQRWVQFTEHSTELRPTKKRAALDALIYGTGVVKTSVHPVVDEIENYRIHPGDIFVDPVECAGSGRPTHLYQRAFVPRGKLKKLFPEAAADIDSANRITDDNSAVRMDVVTLKNMVEVVEGWKLPSYEGCGDGKHIIFIGSKVLVLEDYERGQFPFAFYKWKDDPTVGFWGVSLAEELLGTHFDFNHAITNVQECIDSTPNPIFLVPNDANLSEGQLSSSNGIVLNYDERAPSVVMPPSVPADVVQYALQVWDRGLQIGKLTPLGGIPDNVGARLDSGAALRDYNDITSSELGPHLEEYERFNVTLYEQQVRSGRALFNRNPKFSVVLKHDKYTIEDIDWKKIDDPRKNSFVIQVFPASMLSQTPSGRKSDVLDYFNAGWLDVGEAMDLLDFPDLDRYRDLRTAARRNIERLIEDMLDEGKYAAPEPTIDAALGLKLVQMHINKAQSMGVPEDRISLLRRFMRQLNVFLQKSEEGAMIRQSGAGTPAAGGPPAIGTDGGMPQSM